MVSDNFKENTIENPDNFAFSEDVVEGADFPLAMQRTTPEGVDENIDDKKEFIEKNFYVNGVSAEQLKNVRITNEGLGASQYLLQFDFHFEEGDRQVEIMFDTDYNRNDTFMNSQNYKIRLDDGKMKDVFVNTTIEISETTHNQYDIRSAGNGKREDFSIVYNEDKTKEYIKNIVKSQEITHKKEFEEIEEFENTQLTGLNNPTLGKEVYQDEGGYYYRELYYTTGNKKVNITNVYFNTNGEFNVERTLDKKENLNIMGIDVQYTINENGEFALDEASKQELIEKVRHDRAVIIDLLNNEDSIIDSTAFTGLNKHERDGKNQFDTKIIYLDPIQGIYKIDLTEGALHSLCCKVDGDNVVLLNEMGVETEEVFFNFEEDLYYRIYIQGGKLMVAKQRKAFENPQEHLPVYTGESTAVRLLTNRTNLTSFEDGYLNYFDNHGNAISQIPCTKLDDGNYEFNDEKYGTHVDSLKLFNYSGFRTQVNEINKSAKILGITDADIQDIFNKTLINKNFDFNQKAAEIKNTSTGESVYYNVTRNFEIKSMDKMYNKVRECIDFMVERLDLSKKINDSKILRKNGKKYKDFEDFIGGESGIGKQTISPEQLKKFISGESDEVVVTINRGRGSSTDIIYKASKSGLTKRLASGEGKGRIRLNNQMYTIETRTREMEVDLVGQGRGEISKYTIQNGDIIIDPIEE